MQHVTTTLLRAPYSPCPYPEIHHELHLKKKKGQVNMLSNNVEFEMLCLESNMKTIDAKITSNAFYTKLAFILTLFLYHL